ncbi:MAG: hypothetical protein K2N70_05770 [Helicobacter sp.]|nr:hypothetical protein [Helicobacter sp.]
MYEQKRRDSGKIDIIKALLLSFMAALFGIFGYVVTQNERLTAFIIVCVIAGIVALGAAILLCGRILKTELDKLEKEP